MIYFDTTTSENTWKADRARSEQNGRVYELDEKGNFRPTRPIPQNNNQNRKPKKQKTIDTKNVVSGKTSDKSCPSRPRLIDYMPPFDVLEKHRENFEKITDKDDEKLYVKFNQISWYWAKDNLTCWGKIVGYQGDHKEIAIVEYPGEKDHNSLNKYLKVPNKRPEIVIRQINHPLSRCTGNESNNTGCVISGGKKRKTRRKNKGKTLKKNKKNKSIRKRTRGKK